MARSAGPPELRVPLAPADEREALLGVDTPVAQRGQYSRIWRGPRQLRYTQAGDPVIRPSQYSRFWYNITPWTYRVTRSQFQWFEVRKQQQRRQSRDTGASARSPFGLPMLAPTHPFIAGWSTALLLLDLTYTAILLPLAFGFRLNKEPGWLELSMVVGLLFTVDMIVMLHRGVVLKWMDRLLYVDGFVDVARAYVLYGDFWISLPVALSAPLQLLAVVLENVGTVQHSQLGIMQFLVLVRGLRLVRLLVLQRSLFFGKPALRHSLRDVTYYFMSLLYVLATLLTWLACMMLAIAHHEKPRSITWLASVKGIDLTEAPAWRQFIAAIYFVTITACTVGYGDVSGGTALEQMAVVLTVIVGVTFIAFSVKSMVDVLLDAALQDEGAQRIALLRNRARMLSTWSRWQSTSKELNDKILRFYQGPGLDHAMISNTWGRLMGELPQALRGEVLLQVFFRSHPEIRPLGERLLQGVSPSDAVHVLAQFDVSPVCIGHALCWEGDVADSVWLLQEGELVVLDGVLPSDTVVRGPALIVPFDLTTWVEHQREQQLAGAPPHAHTHPLHLHGLRGLFGQQQQEQQQQQQRQQEGDARTAGGSTRAGQPPPPPCYTQSLQAVNNCFLYRMPLARLALVLRCLPAVRANLLMYFAASTAATAKDTGGSRQK